MSQAEATPALLAKLLPGRAWTSIDAYNIRDGAELISSSLTGSTPRERAKEVRSLQRLRPQLKRSVEHWVLSADPRMGRLSSDQWSAAADRFLDEMGYGGCAHMSVRHTDRDHDHAHICLCRIRAADGRVVPDSHQKRRSHRAAASAAQLIGLQPLPPRAPRDLGDMAAAGQTGVRSKRRARRRGSIENDHRQLRGAAKVVLDRSTFTDWPSLRQQLAEAGVEAALVHKSGGAIQGWMLRTEGAEEWIKSSSLDRSMSWVKVEAQLSANAARRVAPTEAEQATATSTRDAEEALRMELRTRRQRDLWGLLRALRREQHIDDEDKAERTRIALAQLLRLVVRVVSQGVKLAASRAGLDALARKRLAAEVVAEIERRAELDVSAAPAVLTIKRGHDARVQRAQAPEDGVPTAPPRPRGG